MRRAKKEQMDQLLKLIGQALQVVEKCVKNNKYQEAALILEECQDAAIRIGHTIDVIEGENTETVKRLEEYCERLYVMHGALLSDAGIVDSTETEQLKKSYEYIVQCYNKEIYLTKEVVFLPYKAAMWDSLESVWRTYHEDPQWKTKVVPIPYFDKNPDGSFGMYHYEGNEYPADVPITDFQEYNLAENHPDEIYIHNPYDEANHVTTVHPAFYSKQLKHYTDKLIYIPYFVLREPDLINEATIEGIAHFVQTPGVIHADEVIVQSENMRKCYIESMVQFAGEKTRSIWERKIKGTGSPKFDKIINTRKEEIHLPNSWREKIYRSDGSERKVILYNTSLAAFLQDSDEMLEKIRDVLDVFREKKEQVTLLWRPHPLLKATICSMRPLLWEKYSKIVESYIAEDFGIYDDSADLDRAIALADAYYGDISSLVQLCQSVKIPVMIQNVHVKQRPNGEEDRQTGFTRNVNANI